MKTPIAIDRDLSNRISNASLICMFLIVCTHTWVPFEPGSFSRCLWSAVGGVLGSLAVPYFFCVSGFFVAGHMDEDGWLGEALRKRFFSLIVPMFIWCAIWIPFDVLGMVVKNCQNGVAPFEGLPIGLGYWIDSFGLNLFKPPAVSAMWYVRAVFILVLVSPMLRKMACPIGLFLLFVVYCLVKVYYGKSSPIGRFFWFGLSLEGMFYFTLGIFL